MDKVSFFSRQQALRRMTTRLLVLTVVGAIGVGSVGGGAGALAYLAHASREALVPDFSEMWKLAGLGVSITLGSTVIAVAIRLALLHFTASAVRRAFDARELDESAAGESLSAEDRVLSNVVQEMAIAAAVPPPRVLVIDDDETINAFSLAQKSGNRFVGVTAGAQKSLARDELQALVSHEIAHLANGDAAINVRLLALIQGFRWLYDASVALIGWPFRVFESLKFAFFLTFYLAIVFGAFFVVGLFGVGVARLMQAAIARNREYLADASAVQFTRNTLGLLGALHKAAACQQSAKRRPTHKAAFMMFVSPYRARSWLLRTHPKIEDRIEAAQAMTPGAYPAEHGALYLQPTN